MAETFEIMFSCSLPCIHFLKWKIITHAKENWSDNTTQWYNLWLLGRSEYGEGRNQAMVSQEKMPFMFLVMHPFAEMKDHKTWCEKLLGWWYNTMLHIAAKNKEWMWRKGQNQDMVCQEEQMPGWLIVGITRNTEWFFPFLSVIQ